MYNGEKKLWFVFCKTDIMLEKLDDGTYTIPFCSECPVALKPWMTIHNITPMEDGTVVKTVRIPSPVTDNPKYEMMGLRPSYNVLPNTLYLKAGKCQEILYWDEQTKFCGVCGAPMKLHTDISKRCTQCGKEIWPLLGTAVIGLIHKRTDHPSNNTGREEILLVRAKNFRGDYYGLVAGFVETGETLEEALQREVMEETGLSITNIKYYGSQPWPYPCGLMIGFNADYVSGEIKVQESEISNAGWFNIDNMPSIPGKMSIARQLIDYWSSSQKHNK